MHISDASACPSLCLYSLSLSLALFLSYIPCFSTEKLKATACLTCLLHAPLHCNAICDSASGPFLTKVLRRCSPFGSASEQKPHGDFFVRKSITAVTPQILLTSAG